MTTRGRVRPRWSLAVVVALLLAACGGGSVPADPSDALVDAVERTFAGPFAFDVQVELDDAARAQIPSSEVPFAALLDSLEITGHTSGDDALELTVAAMGHVLFELRQTDATHTYLRTDAGRIAEAFGVPMDREQLLAEVGHAPEAVGELWTSLLDGRWVGIVGEPPEAPQAMMMGGIDPSEMQAAQQEAFGDSPGEFARRFTTATPTETGTQDGRALDVALHTRAMAEAMWTAMIEVLGEDGAGDRERADQELARVPETVGGITVEVSNRLIDRVSVDVFEVVRSLSPRGGAGDEPAGSLRLAAELSEHGTTDPVAAPDDVLEVAAEDLGQYHPGGSLPVPGFGSALMWPLAMAFLPIGMSSSVQSVERSVEMGVATEGPGPPPDLSQIGPSPVPPASPEAATVEARPPMHLDVSPYDGPAGSQVTLTVEGFAEGPVEVRWDDRDGPLLATVDGPDFTIEVTVPDDAEPGQHTIVLNATAPGATQGAAISFEVTG